MKLIRWLFSKGKKLNFTDRSRLPKHIAIIMDGNGRWARKRGLSRNYGHREGVVALQRAARYCASLGIEYLTVYAFSTENWKRPKKEIDALHKIMEEYVNTAKERFGQDNMRLKVIGDLSKMPDSLRNKVIQGEKDTASNTGLTVIVAWNYGGRNEIQNAVKSIAREVKNGLLKIDDITEDIISEHMYTKGIPEPDLLIRTSGEQRISNFLIWQTAYAEFCFTPVLWPDIREKDIDEILKVYLERERRFGGVAD